MTWIVSGCAIVVATMALPCAPGTHRGRAQESELNEDWLARDFARVGQIVAALHEKELTVDGLTKHIAGCDIREDREIDFGARRLVIAAYGGYTTAWLHVLAVAPGDDEESAVVELRDEALARTLRAMVGNELGALERPDVPDELRAAFERLTSPFEDLVLGRYHGSDGGPPPGRPEVDALVASGRLDLVRAVLRGMNPEGRAWAAWALLERANRGAELDPADRTAIEKLRKLPIELVTCQGCTMATARFDDALRKI
jgi:hypothetical protein